MAVSKEITKEKRISAEKKKLEKIYKGVEVVLNNNKGGAGQNGGSDDTVYKIKDLPIGRLIERAAFMKVTLEDIEADINKNGYTEMFTQSENAEPYERRRPCVETYNTMIKNYTSVCKQLQEFLPKTEIKKDSGTDEFTNFLNKRKAI